MKVDIEKKVKIELEEKDYELLVNMLEHFLTNFGNVKHESIDFAKQLKQELER